MDGTANKLKNLFEHTEGPIPWLEITVDGVTVLKVLGRTVPPYAMTSSHHIDLPWDDKVAFARTLGVDALGIYHWESFGATSDESKPVLKRIPQIITPADLEKITPRIPTFDEVYPEVKKAKRAMSGNMIALFVELSFCLEYAMADMGFSGFCLALHDNPEFVHKILEMYTVYSATLVDHYCRMDEVDFIWIGDDIAYKNGLFFSPVAARTHILPFFKTVAGRITKPWIYHSDGNITLLIDDILDLGPTAIHPIEPGAMDIVEVKKRYGGKVGLVGNLSVDLMARGSRDDVLLGVSTLLEQCAPGGGYAFSSSNALSKFIPLANLMAASERLREFNSRWQ